MLPPCAANTRVQTRLAVMGFASGDANEGLRSGTTGAEAWQGLFRAQNVVPALTHINQAAVAAGRGRHCPAGPAKQPDSPLPGVLRAPAFCTGARKDVAGAREAPRHYCKSTPASFPLCCVNLARVDWPASSQEKSPPALRNPALCQDGKMLT